jgi:hypothetical protein
MGEKIKLGTVDIPEKAKKWFRYVTKEGEVMAVEPVREKLSEEEKTKRQAERKEKIQERTSQRAKLRGVMTKAKKKAKATLDPADVEEYHEAEAEYEKVMGRV